MEKIEIEEKKIFIYVYMLTKYTYKKLSDGFWMHSVEQKIKNLHVLSYIHIDTLH